MSLSGDDGSRLSRRVIIVLVLAVAVFVLGVAGYRILKPALPAVDYREAVFTSAEADPPEAAVRAPAPASPRVVVFPVLLCSTADTSGHKVSVGLSFTVDGDAAAALLRTREDGVVRIVRFVFSSRVPGQIRADTVRRELLERLNAFLPGAPVFDVGFTAFDIVP